MAATLPLPQSNYQRSLVSSSSDYNEFGLKRSRSNVATGNDWDEQIVPALRKKLEEESQNLSKRLSRLDSRSSTSISSRGKDTLQLPRPFVRPNASTEILQDGLGDDDLIPSAWVTGSSAQFQTFTPRNRIEKRSPAASPNSNASSPLLASSKRSVNSSSPIQSYFPPQQSSTTSNANSGEIVVKARERARKIARERSQTLQRSPISPVTPMSPVSPMSPGSINKSYSYFDGEEDTIQFDYVIQHKPRNRSLSIPNVSDARDLRVESEILRNPSSQEKFANNSPESSSSKDVRKMKSAGILPSSQNSLMKTASVRSSKGAETRLPSSHTYPRYQSTSEGKHKGNEKNGFGPLGSITPKRRLPSRFQEDDLDSTRRTSSNPWDEEMLPTIKRKLEQQRMMEELQGDHDEDLVDTWDRNGLPLSKSPIALKARSSTRSENLYKVSSLHSPTKSERMAMSERDKVEVDRDKDSEQRLQRLQQQLDAGLLCNAGNTANQALVNENLQGWQVESEREREKIEIPQISLKSNQHEDKVDAPPSSKKPEQISEKRKPNLPRGKKEDEAGCCSCTIM